MNVLKILIYKLFLENFYGKKHNNWILLTTFYISYKNNIKTFTNKCVKDTRR